MTKKEIKRRKYVSRHEAGHALTGVVLGIPVFKVSIGETGANDTHGLLGRNTKVGGACVYGDGTDKLGASVRIIDACTTLMGGIAANKEFPNAGCITKWDLEGGGGGYDYRLAVQFAEKAMGGPAMLWDAIQAAEVKEYLNQKLLAAHAILRDNLKALEEIAGLLYDGRTLTGDECIAIVAKHRSTAGRVAGR